MIQLFCRDVAATLTLPCCVFDALFAATLTLFSLLMLFAAIYAACLTQRYRLVD
jgi:nitrogen fixation/metabolism regulation signal transduction histidine kinase